MKEVSRQDDEGGFSPTRTMKFPYRDDGQHRLYMCRLVATTPLCTFLKKMDYL
jgi:hypothetical protein